jgi:hypothetical protein
MRDIERRGSLRGWLPYCLYMDVKARSNTTSCNTVIRLSSRRRSRHECNSRLVYMCESCVRNASVRPRVSIVPLLPITRVNYHSREKWRKLCDIIVIRQRDDEWECLVLSHSNFAATISCQICIIYLEKPCCVTFNSYHVRCAGLRWIISVKLLLHYIRWIIILDNCSVILQMYDKKRDTLKHRVDTVSKIDRILSLILLSHHPVIIIKSIVAR